MSDDLWQRELAQVNRDQHEDEQRRLDERWDRLTLGELSPEEEAEVRALAATSDEAAEAWEAFRPLGAGFQARVVHAIRTQGLAPQAAPASPKSPAKLLPFPWRPTRIGWSAAVAATLATVVVALLLRPAAPFPDYDLAEISGGTSTWRGEETEAAKAFRPGDPFQVHLRPAIQNKVKKLEAQCYLVRGQELHRIETRSELDPRGSVQVDGVIGRDVRPGTWTLWALVGRQGKLPDPDSLRSFSGKARQRDWVALPREVRIQPRSPVP